MGLKFEIPRTNSEIRLPFKNRRDGNDRGSRSKEGQAKPNPLYVCLLKV